MTREQQDKLWNELSEESKERVLSVYQELDKEYEKYKKEGEDTATNSRLEQLLTFEDIFGDHNLNPKPLTYEDVAMELFSENNEKQYGTFYCPVFSEGHCDKISAINALINVAKYLNGDWKGCGYVICINEYDKVDVVKRLDIITSIVSFKTPQLALQAVQILGEDTIRLALSTDY